MRDLTERVKLWEFDTLWPNWTIFDKHFQNFWRNFVKTKTKQNKTNKTNQKQSKTKQNKTKQNQKKKDIRLTDFQNRWWIISRKGGVIGWEQNREIINEWQRLGKGGQCDPTHSRHQFLWSAFPGLKSQYALSENNTLSVLLRKIGIPFCFLLKCVYIHTLKVTTSENCTFSEKWNIFLPLNL